MPSLPISRPSESVEPSALGLRVTTPARRGVCRVQLTGRLDRTTVGLAVAVLEYESRCGHLRLRLDLSDVHHVDDEAMDALVVARRGLLTAGAALDLVGLRTAALAGRLAAREPGVMHLVELDGDA